jgi:hypothetical protein
MKRQIINLSIEVDVIYIADDIENCYDRLLGSQSLIFSNNINNMILILINDDKNCDKLS